MLIFVIKKILMLDKICSSLNFDKPSFIAYLLLSRAKKKFSYKKRTKTRFLILNVNFNLLFFSRIVHLEDPNPC